MEFRQLAHPVRNFASTSAITVCTNLSNLCLKMPPNSSNLTAGQKKQQEEEKQKKQETVETQETREPQETPEKQETHEENTNKYHLKLPAEIGTDPDFRRDIVWFNAIGFLMLHLAGLYGFYLFFYADFRTVIFLFVVGFGSGIGVTIGAHRLFSHKTFKARAIVRLFLLGCHTIAGQNCLYIWVRDHRQHHKYSDTDADPHNANRGFFFSHIGWLMSRKHPAVISKGKTIDMSDLEDDWMVMFQKEHYKHLYVVFALLIPTVMPVLLFNESYWNSLFITFFTRNIVVLNVTWLVNSAAHFYGTKPYDATMRPVQSRLVSFLSVGEGWHNYHHAFPWDYRAAELGEKYSISTMIIDVMAYLRLVYDLKTTSPNMVEHRVLRTGDGSHAYSIEVDNKKAN